MKILVSISFYVPYISGLTICAKNYAEGIAQKGHEVTVFTTQHDKSLAHTEILSEVKVHRVPYLFRLHKGFFMPKFFYKAWSFVRKHDVVVINLPQFEGCILALYARLLGKKVVTIYHCEVSLPKGFLNRIIESLLSISNFFTLLLSQHIVTYTKDYATSTFLLPYFSKKCDYILPPIRIPAINTVLKNEIKQQLPQNAVVIGVAARIAAEKGIEYLLEAIPLIETSLKRDIIILIAGPKNPVGEYAYWNTLKPLLETYQKKLIFLGGIPLEKLGAFYSLLDVLVLPSINKTEAFGIVQIEAMMLSVPVVVSNLPGVRVPTELTGMGERSKLRDAKDLAEKISMIVSHKDRYIKGRGKINSIFSYSQSIESFEKVVCG